MGKPLFLGNLPKKYSFRRTKNISPTTRGGETSKEQLTLSWLRSWLPGQTLAKWRILFLLKKPFERGESLHLFTLFAIWRIIWRRFLFRYLWGRIRAGKAPGNGSPPNKVLERGEGSWVNFSPPVEEGMDSASYAENPKPIYPHEAKEKGHEGEVVLRVEVLANAGWARLR